MESVEVSARLMFGGGEDDIPINDGDRSPLSESA